jgi:hypothetical protein
MIRPMELMAKKKGYQWQINALVDPAVFTDLIVYELRLLVKNCPF